MFIGAELDGPAKLEDSVGDFDFKGVGAWRQGVEGVGAVGARGGGGHLGAGGLIHDTYGDVGVGRAAIGLKNASAETDRVSLGEGNGRDSSEAAHKQNRDSCTHPRGG